MLAAAFETSTLAPSVAVRAGEKLLEQRLSGSHAHASDMLPALDRLLAQVDRPASELDLIVVGTGPGSFTGLRVAVATALGLARGGRAELFGLPSGEALCWRELRPGEDAAVVLDARQGRFTFARYRRSESSVEVLQAPSLVAAEDLLELAAPCRRIFGEPSLALFPSLPEELRKRLELDHTPAASAVLELGSLRRLREGAHLPPSLEPLYLRAFGATPPPRRGG